MQIVSNCGNLVIDYYPTKSILNNKPIPDNNLKVVTFNGRTQYKVILNDYALGSDIIEKNDSGDYIITDNTKSPYQFVNQRGL